MMDVFTIGRKEEMVEVMLWLKHEEKMLVGIDVDGAYCSHLNLLHLQYFLG